MKTATITFHASHNYGSMLQAYALQQVLKNKIGVENEILNLRTEVQKKVYPNPSNIQVNLKAILKRIWNLPMQSHLQNKYRLFEKFLSNCLILSPEFSSGEDMINYVQKFDYLISGSDQIWNTICTDFDWSYYLPFARNNAIAYAPSMGPYPLRQVAEANYEKIGKCLSGFKAISVREKGTAELVRRITGRMPQVLVDPTMLLSKNDWDILAGKSNILDEKYILLYSPSYTVEICEIASDISSLIGLPIVVSNKLPTKFLMKQKRGKFKQILDCGPIEFIKLVRNAEFVISGSFHAIVFSILYRKPFLAYKGDVDSRMKQVLSNSMLLDYAFDRSNYISKLDKLNHINFSASENYIREEYDKSFTFLKNSLGV